MKLDDFFKQWLHTTKQCDYAIARFKVKPARRRASPRTVRIERKGELMMPLTLAFRLKNGNTVVERLDGAPRTIEKSFTFDSKPVSAAINPDNEILDVYRLDNYSPRRRSFALDVPFNSVLSGRLLPVPDPPDRLLQRRRRREGWGSACAASYDNYYRKFTLQGLYGFESGKIDFYAAYESPLGYLGKDASVFAEMFKREGRQGASLEIGKIRRTSLFDPLAKRLALSLNYHEITDTAYVFPGTYEEGKDINGGVRLEIAPKTDVFATAFSLAYDRSLWGSNFNFEKLAASVKLWPAIRFDFPVKPNLRFFVGHAANDPPTQERFSLAGANTLAKERYFWLRSVGAFPKDQYNNFHVAGDANLRGYFDGTFAFKQSVRLERRAAASVPASR